MYRCCRHCVDPCPASGHRTICGECTGNGSGRKVAEGCHYPPGTVRTIPVGKVPTQKDLREQDEAGMRALAWRRARNG